MIEPRATYEPSWGLCDRLWHAVHPTATAHVPPPDASEERITSFVEMLLNNEEVFKLLESAGE
jgi:hypothetical protein